MDNNPPTDAVMVSDDVAYTWTCDEPPGHVHDIGCLWVWHDCAQVLGPTSVDPGARFGWRPSGVGAHTLVQTDPLTITASVYWPDCCGMHGFITNGQWIRA